MSSSWCRGPGVSEEVEVTAAMADLAATMIIPSPNSSMVLVLPHSTRPLLLQKKRLERGRER